jgi:adenylate kinase
VTLEAMGPVDEVTGRALAALKREGDDQ